jgi:hypothetical protein
LRAALRKAKLLNMEDVEDFEGFDVNDFHFSDVAWIRKRQRFYRKSELDALPAPLKNYLSNCPFVYLPNRYDSRILNSLTVSPQGVGDPPRTLKGYNFRKFIDKHDMVEAAQAVGNEHDDKEAYLWMGAGVPFFLVPLGWVRQNLPELVRPDFAVIAKTLKVGLVMTNELGVCHRVQRPDNPPTVKFILAVWGY